MRNFLALLLLMLPGLSAAQILDPAKWRYETSAQSVKTGDEVELIFKATIDKDWYLYSSEFPCEDGPIKATFTFTPHPGYQLIGTIQPVGAIDKHDDIFECDVKIFKKTAEFRQRIKVLSANLKLAGEFEYQVCTELTGQCIPGGGDFEFTTLKVSGAAIVKEQEQKPEPKTELKEERDAVKHLF